MNAWLVQNEDGSYFQRAAFGKGVTAATADIAKACLVWQDDPRKAMTFVCANDAKMFSDYLNRAGYKTKVAS